MPAVVDTKEYTLTTEAVAKRLGVSAITVWRWIDNWRREAPTPWKLPAMRTGHGFRVSESDLDDLLRRTNPKLWREMAEADQAERKTAQREAKKLRERLG